jgi:hypothetical protein
LWMSERHRGRRRTNTRDITKQTRQIVFIEQKNDALLSRQSFVEPVLSGVSTTRHLPVTSLQLTITCLASSTAADAPTTRECENINFLIPPTREHLTQDRHPRPCSRVFSLSPAATAIRENDKSAPTVLTAKTVPHNLTLVPILRPPCLWHQLPLSRSPAPMSPTRNSHATTSRC